jgi:hypothetical protein
MFSCWHSNIDLYNNFNSNQGRGRYDFNSRSKSKELLTKQLQSKINPDKKLLVYDSNQRASWLVLGFGCYIYSTAGQLGSLTLPFSLQLVA